MHPIHSSLTLLPLELRYPELGFEAGVKAMLDAQINYDDVEMGVACYCYGDTTSGQRIFVSWSVFFVNQSRRFADIIDTVPIRHEHHPVGRPRRSSF